MSEKSESRLATVGAPRSASLILAGITGMQEAIMLDAVHAQCFKGDAKVTEFQVAAFVSIAAAMGVNPFLPGMLYAYAIQGGGIVPIMGPDGVYKKLTEHPDVDSWETEVFPTDVSLAPTHATTKIWRKGRDKPLTYTAALAEWKVSSNPNWNSRPRHMLGLRSLKHCARQIIHGIPFDEDERRIMEAIDVTPEGAPGDAPLRPAPKPPAAKGAAVAKENAAPKGGVVVDGQLVDDKGAQTPPAAAQTPPPAEPPKPPAKPKGAPKPAAIVQRTSLQDKEVITVVATVNEFSTREITKAGVPHPSVSASIVSPELKGDVFHLGGAKTVEGQLEADPAWSIEKPVRLTIRGEFSAKLNRVVSWVEKAEAVEAPAETQPKGDDV